MIINEDDCLNAITVSGFKENLLSIVNIFSSDNF